mmetsp:Transcript_16748/g.46804  ORF Transcript_16748/g.46804 Transcript_16748/m.46804 type:complete len:975 (+) Transcript_16748:187-3111(+)
MSGKKSVDDIWAALNARPASRGAGGGSTEVNINSFGGLPGIKTTSRYVASGGDQLPNRAGPVADDAFQAVAVTAAKTGAAYDPLSAGVTAEERDAFVLTFQRDINCLSDPEKGTRRRALEKLHVTLIKGAPSSPAPSPGMLQAVVCGPLLAPMVNLLADPMEKVRELDVQLWAAVLGRLQDTIPLLPALVPALHRRMGSLPVEEPSEEVRLELAQLLGEQLAPRVAGHLLQSYKEELVAILMRCLEDSFHEIKKAGSAALVEITRQAARPGMLESDAEPLAADLLANSSHQHSKVRQASVEGLGALVASGVPPGVIADLVAPGLKPVLFDRSAASRKAVVEVVASWLGASGGGSSRTGAGQLDDWRPRLPSLLPLLMTGVTDIAAEISSLSLSLLNQVGAAYQALVAADQRTEATAKDGATPMEEDDSREGTEPPASASAPARDMSWLGQPYNGPLSAGAEAVVRDNLKGLTATALRDIRDWSVGTRLVGARLLHTTLVHAGPAAEEHADLLVAAMCSAVGDDDADVASRVVACVHVFGAAAAPAVWLPLALDQLARGGQQTAAQVANTLVVLAGLLHAASASISPSNPPPVNLLERMASAVMSEDIRGVDHPAVQQQLLAVTTNLTKLAGAGASAIVLPLLTIILQLKADPYKTALCKGAEAVLQDLAVTCGATHGETLVGKHAASLLASIAQTHPTWTVGSADRLTMASLLWTADASALRGVVPMTLNVLQDCIPNTDRDPAMRIEMLRMVDALLESEERGAAFGGEAGVPMLTGVLLPTCVWVAGKTAAAIRFHAITATATFFRRKLVSQPELLSLIQHGEVLPVVHQCLEEDYYADTRLVACHVMAGLLRCAGEGLSDGSRRAVYPELCKRLDDSSDANRIAGCEALEAFAEVSPSYDATNTHYLLERLLVHMDDFNSAVQEAVCKVVLRLARSHPEVVREAVTKVASRHRSKEYIQRALAACNAVGTAP